MLAKDVERQMKRDTVMVPTSYGVRLELYWEGRMVYTVRCKDVAEASKRAEEYWKRSKYR